MNEYTVADEKLVKELMSTALTEGPTTRTKELMPIFRRRKRKKHLKIGALAASLLIMLLASSPFAMPAMARALSAVPIIGPGFEAALKLHSLDLAYEAGLLPTLDKTVEGNGVSVTVQTAYRDEQTFDILLSFRSDDPELIECMYEHIGPYVELTSGRWTLPGNYSSKSYDEEQKILYLSLSSFEPLPWYVRKLNVSVSWPTDYSDMEEFKYGVSWDLVEMTEPVSLTFPLQSSRAYVATVPVNHTFVYEETTVTVERVVFSPVRTILHYSYTGNDPRISLYDQKGNPMRWLTGGGEPGKVKDTYAATDSAEIIIRLKGLTSHPEVQVPLVEGYEHNGEPYFRVDSIEPAEKRLTAFITGDPVYADTKVVLSWSRGDWWVMTHSIGEEHVEEDKVTLYLRREGLPEDYPLWLTFSHFVREEQEIRVTR